MFQKNEREIQKRKGVAFICVALLWYTEMLLEWFTDKKMVSEILPLLILLFSITILLWYLRTHGGFEYYGLSIINHPRNVIYYVPFWIVSLYYLSGGLVLNYAIEKTVIRVGISMAMAVLESILFHGFLFRIWSETNPDRAIIITSVYYGLLKLPTPKGVLHIENSIL